MWSLAALSSRCLRWSLLIAKGRDGAPLACLLIGAAATVKEPFILALPFVWLAGEPWRRDWRDFVQLSAAAVAAGVPFVVYCGGAQEHRCRRPRRQIGRSNLAVSTEGLSHYASEFITQMGIAFPGTSGLLAAAALLLIPIMLAVKSERRLVLACLFGAACLVASLFVFDRVSQRWAGYFRFMMYSLPFLTAAFCC